MCGLVNSFTTTTTLFCECCNGPWIELTVCRGLTDWTKRTDLTLYDEPNKAYTDYIYIFFSLRLPHTLSLLRTLTTIDISFTIDRGINDIYLQEICYGTAPDLRQIFPARVFFRSSFLKCLEHSPSLRSFPSSRPIACIHFFFNLTCFLWIIESTKLLTRLLPITSLGAFWNAAMRGHL